jgi:hypothetical protein
VDKIVDLLSRHARAQQGANPLERACRHSAHFAHERNLTLALDFD